MNKETLKEAAKKYIGFPLNKNIDEEQRYFNPNVKTYDAFIDGAKYQQERSYSEEDMTNYALYILHNNVITPKEWLKQFKKK